VLYWDVCVGVSKKPTASIFRGEKWIYNCHHEDWRRSAAVYLLWLWVRILPGAWVFVYCNCCVLSGRGLCHELITRPEESYRMWCAVVCVLETSWMRRPWPTGGYAQNKNWFGRFHQHVCVCQPKDTALHSRIPSFLMNTAGTTSNVKRQKKGKL